MTPRPDDTREAAGLLETRRRFLLAREQVAQCSVDRYRAVRKMREWKAPERAPARSRRA
jgi:hypothetical protein